MGVARIAILVVAALAAGVAALLVRNLVSGNNQATANTTPEIIQMPTTEVLVANTNLNRGKTIVRGSLRWQPWPEDGIAPSFVVKNNRPKALEDSVGSVVRMPIMTSEPITPNKVVSTGENGFMAAILEPGKRAISVKISPETGAGGFILPNDRVDIILTEEKDSDFGGSMTTSNTVLENIRILAIDQTYRETEDNQVVIGKTATLELSPGQAELLALSQAVGDIQLALRSLSDSGPIETVDTVESKNYGTLRMYRYGAESSVPIGSSR